MSSENHSPWLTSQRWHRLRSVSNWRPRHLAGRLFPFKFRTHLGPADTGVPIAVAVSGDKSIGQTPIFWGPDKDAAAVEVGDENQQRFIDEAARPLLEKLGADCSRTGDSG